MQWIDGRAREHCGYGDASEVARIIRGYADDVAALQTQATKGLCYD